MANDRRGTGNQAKCRKRLFDVDGAIVFVLYILGVASESLLTRAVALARCLPPRWYRRRPDYLDHLEVNATIL